MSDSNSVKKLAELARLTIPAEEAEEFTKEFEHILKYVSALESLSISMSTPPALGTVHNVFRDDTESHEDGVHTEAIVKAFPQKEGNSLSVKQIISYD